MDLVLTPDQASFRDELRDWLASNVPDALPSFGMSEGFAAHREWERTLAQAGYGAIHWPTEYGGRGAGPIEQAIFEEEYVLAGGPTRVTVLGHNLFGPTLMRYGTDEQKARWLPDLLAAETIWSQGYSEPEAGSDLASVRTRAALDGDEFVVNGQKIWTSHGAFADWMFALVRTDPDAPKHEGITFLCLDLSTPGVEVRPIRGLDGHTGFAEVFFTDARVPADQVVGDVNDGWRVAMTALEFERDAPAAAPAAFERDLNTLIDIAHARGLVDDVVVRDRLAELHVRVECYRQHSNRTLATLVASGDLGSMSSVTKLYWSELGRDIHGFGLELLGRWGEALDESSGLARPEEWHARYWYSRAATIYAGTSEIQRNIIAQRVLGLPRA